MSVFCGYVGPADGWKRWEGTVVRYASWAGLLAGVGRWAMRDGRSVGVALLGHTPPSLPGPGDSGDWVVIRTGADPGVELNGSAEYGVRWPPTGVGENAVRMGIGLAAGEIRVTVPLATPEPFVHTGDQERGVVFGNDPRLVGCWAGFELDAVAVWSLLQFGMVPAPYTVFRTMSRVSPGHAAILSSASHAMPKLMHAGERERAGEFSEALVLSMLDGQLSEFPEPSLLFFSGGVDSALMAARLVEMGRRDVTLFNFAFGPDDEEAQLAARMAGHFGLPFEQVMFDPGELPAVLTRAGRDYTYPFGDYSTIPTNLLVHAALERVGAGRTVIEGTGGDGGFGPAVRNPARWERLYALPGSVRAALGAGYKWLRMWEWDAGESYVARLCSTARRSLQMDLEPAALVSQNALDGIAYSIPPEARRTLGEAILAPLRTWGGPMSMDERFGLLDMIHICAGRFAPKSFDPLRLAGMRPVYPFLEPVLVKNAFRIPWEEKNHDGLTKVLLKRLLARSVPAEWVYRRKSGFAPPIKSIFALPAVQEFFRGVVLSRANPLLDWVDARVLREMADRAAVGGSQDKSVLSFLWTMTFASAWLAQSRQGMEAAQGGERDAAWAERLAAGARTGQGRITA